MERFGFLALEVEERGEAIASHFRLVEVDDVGVPFVARVTERVTGI